MFKILLTVMFIFLSGCIGNKAEVPAKIENCFKDPQTGECTNRVDIVVKHIITIELPTQFIDACKTKYNETDYPNSEERTLLYNKCISDYLETITDIVKGFDPSQIPTP